MNDMSEKYFIGSASRKVLYGILKDHFMSEYQIYRRECIILIPSYQEKLKNSKYKYTIEEIKDLFYKGELKIIISRKPNIAYYYKSFSDGIKIIVSEESSFLPDNNMFGELVEMVSGGRTSISCKILDINSEDIFIQAVMTIEIKNTLRQKYNIDNNKEFWGILKHKIISIFYNDRWLYGSNNRNIECLNKDLWYCDNDSSYMSVLNKRKINTKYIIIIVDIDNNIYAINNNGTEYDLEKIDDIQKLYIKKMAVMYNNYNRKQIIFNPQDYTLYSLLIKSSIYTTVLMLKRFENNYNKNLKKIHKIKLGKPILFYIIRMSI